MKTNLLPAFAKKFNLQPPAIIQAPMAGGITTPQLVAAVSNAQGLGTFAAGYLNAKQVKTGITRIKQLTAKPFAVNLFVPQHVNLNMNDINAYQQALKPFQHALGMSAKQNVPDSNLTNDEFTKIIELLLTEKIEIVSFTFGNLPSQIIDDFKKNGTYLIGTATSLEEAKILADSGSDAIVVQGYEAGGHRGSFYTSANNACLGMMALLPQIVDQINLPIIAAGGIMDNRGIIAAIALGASAVQMGTAFLTTQESGANQTYKNELLKTKTCGHDNTTLTNVYSGKPARGLKTEFIAYMTEHLATIPPYPLTHILSQPIRQEAAKQKAAEIMSMWCGQGVPLITDNLSASDLVKKLQDEVKKMLEILPQLFANN